MRTIGAGGGGPGGVEGGVSGDGVSVAASGVEAASSGNEVTRRGLEDAGVSKAGGDGCSPPSSQALEGGEFKSGRGSETRDGFENNDFPLGDGKENLPGVSINQC